MNEETKETVRREFVEELGFQVKINRLLWVIENFNAYGYEKLHEFGMYYLVEPFDTNLSIQPAEFEGIEKAEKLIFKWFDIHAIDEINIYPRCLAKLLQEASHEVIHVINNDLAKL